MLSIVSRYKAGIRRSIQFLGVDRSIERKVLAAVAIQFLISIGQAVLSVVVAGAVRVALVAALFVGATLAFVNTVWLVREDVIEPVTRLDAAAAEIADGAVDVDVPDSDMPDEVGSLTRSFGEMQSHLTVVSAQADALAEQDFEADVLDEDVPGTFGESLDRMAENLEAYTSELEELTRDLERRSERLEELVAAVGDAADRAADGDLTATIDADAVAGDEDDYRELCENFNDLVESVGIAIADVRSFATEVSAASDDVAESVTELDRASEDVAGSVAEISEGATRQSEQFQSVADEMNDLSATVEEIAASADEVAQTAATAADRGQSGRESATDAIDALDDVERRMATTADAVDGLADRIGEIEEIVSFIDGIAEETNSRPSRARRPRPSGRCTTRSVTAPTRSRTCWPTSRTSSKWSVMSTTASRRSAT
jgi:methyl-accepting chemotaxis protein